MRPNGLARFLARHQNDRQWQRIYLTNWLVVVALTLGFSLLVLVPVGLFLRLNGWIFIGAIANLVGIAVFTTYREAQRVGWAASRAWSCTTCCPTCCSCSR